MHKFDVQDAHHLAAIKQEELQVHKLLHKSSFLWPLSNVDSEFLFYIVAMNTICIYRNTVINYFQY